jgi:hypothetical protein
MGGGDITIVALFDGGRRLIDIRFGPKSEIIFEETFNLSALQRHMIESAKKYFKV